MDSDLVRRSFRSSLVGSQSIFTSFISLIYQIKRNFLRLCLFPGIHFPGKPLSKLSCVCLPLEKLVNGKHFPVKGKFGLVSRKIWAENTFRKL